MIKRLIFDIDGTLITGNGLNAIFINPQNIELPFEKQNVRSISSINLLSNEFITNI